MTLGADGAGLDIVATAHGVPVLLPDRDHAPTTSHRGDVNGTRLAEMRALDGGNGQLLPTLDDVCVPISGPLRLDREQNQAAIGRARPPPRRRLGGLVVQPGRARGLASPGLGRAASATGGRHRRRARRRGPRVRRADGRPHPRPLTGNVPVLDRADGERGSGAAAPTAGRCRPLDRQLGVRPPHTAHPAGPRFAYPAARPSPGTGGPVPVAPIAHGKEERPR